MGATISSLKWVGGVGFLGPLVYPAACKSLGHLLVYFDGTAPSTGCAGKPYSLNGVPADQAVAVDVTPPGGANTWGIHWVLYTAPDSAHLAWYYIMSWLNTTPGVNYGPVVTVTGSKTARFGGISNCGEAILPIACVPNMSKLTAL